MTISTKILIYLISVLVAFAGGYLLRNCSGEIRPPQIIDNQIVIRDTVMKTIQIDSIRARGKRIVTPDVVFPDEDTVSKILVKQLDSALYRLGMLDVSIIYRDTLITEYNDIIEIEFNAIEKKFGLTTIKFAERQLPITERTIIPVKGIVPKRWYEEPIAIGIGSGLIGIILGILLMV